MRTIGHAVSLLLFTGSLYAQTVIVEEDFESYGNDNDLYFVWEPKAGSGFDAPANPDDGILDDGTLNPTAYPGDGMGGLQGVDHLASSVLQYVPDLGSEGFIAPTETQSVYLQADIFDTGAAGNKRLSVGLRKLIEGNPPDVDHSAENIVELGFWNSDPIGFAYRAINFDSSGDNPNWQFFELPQELDRTDDADEIVNSGDVLEAWHRYSATITPTNITFEIDLYRDGINNGTEEPGVDASVSWNSIATANGFDSLRIGGPSGVTSPGSAGVVFDNILLQLIDVETGNGVPGDYNEDGTVNAADYVVFRNLNGQSVSLPNENPDAATPGLVDPEDYTFWAENYGNSGESGSASAAVPEPAAVLLSLIALAGLAVGVDRRRICP